MRAATCDYCGSRQSSLMNKQCNRRKHFTRTSYALPTELHSRYRCCPCSSRIILNSLWRSWAAPEASGDDIQPLEVHDALELAATRQHRARLNQLLHPCRQAAAPARFSNLLLCPRRRAKRGGSGPGRRGLQLLVMRALAAGTREHVTERQSRRRWPWAACRNSMCSTPERAQHALHPHIVRSMRAVAGWTTSRLAWRMLVAASATSNDPSWQGSHRSMTAGRPALGG